MMQGSCRDSEGNLYAYVTVLEGRLRFPENTPVPEGKFSESPGSCLEYCIQDKVNLVGLQIPSPAYKKEKNIGYCSCEYSGGVGVIDPSLFEPAPDVWSTEEVWKKTGGKGVGGKGPVKSGTGGITKDWYECYPLKPRPKPAPRPAPRPASRPSWPSTAVVNWKTSINAKEIDSKEDIPSTCLENYYDVELKSIANDKDGAHFFLSASVHKREKTSNENCPQFFAFASRDEKKRIYHIPDFSVGNGYRYSSYLFGKVTLKAIMDAESSVEAVQDKDYDLTGNSCIHYAGRIWRALHLDETNELANFLVENLLKNDGFLTIARQKYSAGGLRVLSFVKGKGSFENFVKDTVYSQLNIKNDGEYSIGKNSDVIARLV
eukprot:scaffold64935_cov31-Cyclotella_meneghiniana.AAC.2